MTLRALLPAGRPTGLAVVLGFAACVLAVPADLTAQAPATKRPLKHSDYEIWNSASGYRLSPDGKHFVYNFTPAEGDGAVVIRNVPKGTEHRIPSGGKAVAAATESKEATAPQPEPQAVFGGGGFTSASGLAQFTPDSKKVVLTLAPPRSAVDRAKAAKKKPDESPKTVLAVIDLATGKVTDRFEKARSFSVVGAGAGYLVYHKEPKAEDQPKGKDQPKEQLKAAPRPAGEPDGDQPPGTGRKGGGGRGMGGAPGDARPTAPRQTYGTDLVVRDLADGSETVIADVAEISVTKDHKQIVYTVQSKTADHNGVYAAPLASASNANPVRTGPGRYFRLTWDEKQTRLAYFYTEPGQTPTPEPAPPPKADDVEEAELDQQRQFPRPGATTPGQTTPAPPLPPAKVRVFVWARSNKPAIARSPMAAVTSAVAYTAPESRTAAEILGPETVGLKDGYSVVDRGGLSFTADGLKLTVGVAKVPDKPADPAPTNPAGAVAGPAGRIAPTPRTDDRIDLDIWHWKDELVQPMQKVRRGGDRDRNQRAVYFLDTKETRQLDDEDTTVAVPGHGDWAVASSDKKYRGMQWLSPTPRDYSLLNVRTGEGKPLLQSHEGSLTRSPKGKCVVAFDGKNWHAQPCPDGKMVNITGKLKVKFYSEDYDSPSVAPAYGLLGFTPDEKHVLLADRYDVWKVAVDGSGAENVTKVGRQLKTRFRPVRLDDDPSDDRGIDLTKPMLLSAENLETYDTGYYRLEPGQKPKMLVMGARQYGGRSGGLTKAKDADVYVFTVSTYSDYPDYYIADKDFKEVERVTDVNPRVKEYNWGKAELVHYHSADGVPLKGILIKPEDFDPSKKYPMVVYIYERLSQGLHTFRLPSAGTSINLTYYASNGYLVYMPDIAYTVGSPGQSALKCVLPAIQAVVDQGCVDEDAIGIQGHSWGGYQIAYMVTQTNRFKAAAAGAPVSNMTSAYGGIRWGSGMPRQFQYEKTQSRIGKSLWEAPMRYIENSPLFMADRVETPLLMLHNDQDDAVPWYQGVEYYLALRRLGKEVYLLNYNGEFHGLRKKATQRDYTLRMQQFFDHHLKGAPAPEWMTKGVPFNERDKEKEQWKKLFEPVKN